MASSVASLQFVSERTHFGRCLLLGCPQRGRLWRRRAKGGSCAAWTCSESRPSATSPSVAGFWLVDESVRDAATGTRGTLFEDRRCADARALGLSMVVGCGGSHGGGATDPHAMVDLRDSPQVPPFALGTPWFWLRSRERRDPGCPKPPPQAGAGSPIRVRKCLHMNASPSRASIVGVVANVLYVAAACSSARPLSVFDSEVDAASDVAADDLRMARLRAARVRVLPSGDASGLDVGAVRPDVVRLTCGIMPLYVEAVSGEGLRWFRRHCLHGHRFVSG